MDKAALLNKIIVWRVNYKISTMNINFSQTYDLASNIKLSLTMQS